MIVDITRFEIESRLRDLNVTMWFAGCWLHDILEHYERTVAGEWPYDSETLRAPAIQNGGS